MNEWVTRKDARTSPKLLCNVGWCRVGGVYAFLYGKNKTKTLFTVGDLGCGNDWGILYLCRPRK